MAILRRRMKAPCTAVSGIHHETLPSYEEQQPFGAHESYNENDSKSLSLTYQQLQEGQYCCDIIPSEPAIWVSKSTGLRLSTLALSVIEDSGSLPPDDLEAFDFNKHIKGSSYRDPISGLISTAYGTVVEVLGAATSIPSTACVTRIIRAGLMAPHDYTMALTEGFHNVPKLYGDDTVRDASEVVGFQSGMAAAGKGLGFGLYDGISGFVMQPVRGVQREGAVGLLKGFGKGVGGLVCKPCAGACGVPGYALRGLHIEINKQWRRRGRITK